MDLSIVLNWSLDVGTQLLFFISFFSLGLSVDRSRVGTGVRDYLVSELLRPVILFRLSMSKCIYYTQVTPN